MTEKNISEKTSGVVEITERDMRQLRAAPSVWDLPKQMQAEETSALNAPVHGQFR